jgi:uncharacterized protein (TIRG00374 family)
VQRASGRSGWTRSTLLLIGIAGTVGFGYLAVRHIQWSQVWDGLRTSNYWWALPSVTVLALAIGLKILRWRALFLPQRRPPLGALTASLLVCYFFNTILPARAGELARIIDLGRRARVSRAETGATVILERIYDVFALLVLFFVLLPWFPHITWLRTAGVLGGVLALAIVLAITALTIFGDRPLQLVTRPLRRLPIAAERVEAAPRNLAHGLASFRDWRLAVRVLSWSLASWIVTAVSFWLLMRGFHLGLGILAAALVVVATNLAQVLPSLPSALGVFEAATVVALRAYHVSDAEALSYALVLHAITSLAFIVSGAAVLAAEPKAARRRLASSL